MPICPECESVLDFDAEDVEEGDTLECDECGTEFEVVSVDPLEITKVDETEDDDEYKEEEEEEE
jgi:alpha-aminoadipate/glutamate carrier protein LysW